MLHKILLSLSLTISSLFAIPSAPTDLKLAPISNTEVSIEWNHNSNDERGFKIFRDNILITVAPQNSRGFIDHTLKPDSTYTYTIKATDDTQMYENAQNGTENWHVFDNSPAGATIKTIYDDEKKSTVISLLGAGSDNAYQIGGSWNNTEDKIFSWQCKSSEYFTVYIDVKTTNGRRYLIYSTENRDLGLYNQTNIHHALGNDILDGKWHTIERNLEDDINEYEEGNKLISINSMIVRGSGQIDNIITSKSFQTLHTRLKNVTLYVDDNTVDDNGNGTNNQPFKTIQTALNNAQAGDKVFIKKGIYHERIKVPHSGNMNNPIVIEGEVDDDGKRLVTVHGGDLVKAHWEKADEIGPLVYKTQDIPYESFAMTIMENGISKDIPRLYAENRNKNLYLDGNIKDENDTYGYKDILALKPDRVIKTRYNEVDIYYWDGIEALYTYVQSNKTTYVRFRDGEDPNNMKLYTAPGRHNIYGNNEIYEGEYIMQESATFDLENKSYITIQNLNIDGAQNGVLIYGAKSFHNVINNNEIVNGQRKISIAQNANNNIIKNNILHMNLLSSYRPGAWRGANNENLSKDELYKRAVSEHYYITYKREIGYETFAPLDDSGIFIHGAGSENNIFDNEIYDTLCGIGGAHKGNAYIHHNYIHHISDMATALFKRSEDTYIYKNYFLDNNSFCRIFLDMNENELEFLKKKAYLFQNISLNPKGLGQHFYFNREGNISNPNNPDFHPEIYIFHNTFVGAGDDRNRVTDIGSKIVIINNIFHGVRPIISQVENANNNIGIVAYNWFNLLGTNRENDILQQANFQGFNQTESNHKLWDVPDIPTSKMNFRLKEGDIAMDSAIDVSKPFTINGKEFPKMPLIYPGYFLGENPNIGEDQLKY